MELISKQMVHEGEVFTESLKATIHIPTIRFNTVLETSIWGNYKVTEVDFGTRLRYHRNVYYMLLDIKLLGFGFTILMHRRLNR